MKNNKKQNLTHFFPKQNRYCNILEIVEINEKIGMKWVKITLKLADSLEALHPSSQITLFKQAPRASQKSSTGHFIRLALNHLSDSFLHVQNQNAYQFLLEYS